MYLKLINEIDPVYAFNFYSCEGKPSNSLVSLQVPKEKANLGL